MLLKLEVALFVFISPNPPPIKMPKRTTQEKKG